MHSREKEIYAQLKELCFCSHGGFLEGKQGREGGRAD